MPIQNVTKKRTGKATKRKQSSASKTMAIRAMRAAFFLIIGLFIVYVYFLYENGSLIESIKSLNMSDLFIAGLTFIKKHPIIILFLIIYGGTFLWIGYRLGVKRS